MLLKGILALAVIGSFSGTAFAFTAEKDAIGTDKSADERAKEIVSALTARSTMTRTASEALAAALKKNGVIGNWATSSAGARKVAMRVLTSEVVERLNADPVKAADAKGLLELLVNDHQQALIENVALAEVVKAEIKLISRGVTGFTQLGLLAKYLTADKQVLVNLAVLSNAEADRIQDGGGLSVKARHEFAVADAQMQLTTGNLAARAERVSKSQAELAAELFEGRDEICAL